VHGRLVYFHFGHPPIELRLRFGVVLGGFGIVGNIPSFNSFALNCHLIQGPYGTHDWLDKKMSQNEIKLINSAI
jgi:hypothetical protein